LLGSDLTNLPDRFERAGGIVNIAASGETSWHGFATRIVDGLKSRKIPLAARAVLPLRTDEYPTKARRPGNSRFDLTRLREVFGLTTPLWNEALEVELDQLAEEIHSG
jgi:dTDP-4-dehydrorhamnose reductase